MKLSATSTTTPHSMGLLHRVDPCSTEDPVRLFKLCRVGELLLFPVLMFNRR
jgi:hypothetical protein